ncbi:MAG: right-handed parallel beta-helix repeat-containing protein [Verrucomicrobiota bacterium]|nr:right-handed parallel beta-helix repeat-containing protein [Verrucomicrobiota bacterium]
MMRRLALLSVLFASAALAEEWQWQDALVPEPGFDLDAAQVFRVTSLAADGKGTLREALRKKGPRIVVFEIGGVIDLRMKSLQIEAPQVFVAGQSAPAPGITLIRGGLTIKADQAVVQHLRVRPGDAGRPRKSGWQPDGITTAGAPAGVWIDHCSVTWAVDENISASTSQSPAGEPAGRIFIRDCLIAEGLRNATHEKGEHSKGTLVLDGTREVAIVGNLYASNTERNPVFKLNTSGVVVNNVIANPGQRAIHASVPDAESAGLPRARLAVVGNIVLLGEKTKKTAAIFEGVADGFFKDNEGYNWLGEPVPELRQPFPTLAEPPLWPAGLKARSPAAALWHVARFAGARPAERDAIDTRIVREVLTGAGRIIDSQDEVGGYPKIDPVQRPLEVPDKNRRAWLEQLAREVIFGPARISSPKPQARVSPPLAPFIGSRCV